LVLCFHRGSAIWIARWRGLSTATGGQVTDGIEREISRRF
jgi:hypothetical protein